MTCQLHSNRAIDSDVKQALLALAGARHRGRYAPPARGCRMVVNHL